MQAETKGETGEASKQKENRLRRLDIEPKPPNSEKKLKPYETETQQIRPKNTVGGIIITEIQNTTANRI